MRTTSTRIGLGAGKGIGYKNLVPMDKYVHQLAGKGVKTYSSFPTLRKVFKFEDMNPDYIDDQLKGLERELEKSEKAGYYDDGYIKEKVENAKRQFNSVLDNFESRVLASKELRQKFLATQLDAKKYTYLCCGDCKHEFTTTHSPQEYRQATGKFVSCCGEPMRLVNILDAKKTKRRYPSGTEELMDKEWGYNYLKAKSSYSVDKLVAYESGELNDRETLKLFSGLIKSGLAWQLQGSYGRTAAALIDDGWISKTGKILKYPA